MGVDKFDKTVVDLLVFVATRFLVNHFDLFGLRQVQFAARGKRYTSLPMSATGLYKHVRHPINLGFLIAIWAASTMTVGHIIFSLAMTIYILLATSLEERDLIAKHVLKRQQMRLAPDGEAR